MSFNRENVVWQSPDGTWNMGFFDVSWTDPDGDPEWDVEYDYGFFGWVSTGHSSEDAAYRSWPGANPGGSMTVPYTERYASECDSYDDMARSAQQR